jgi:hypothetical protein
LDISLFSCQKDIDNNHDLFFTSVLKLSLFTDEMFSSGVSQKELIYFHIKQLISYGQGTFFCAIEDGKYAYGLISFGGKNKEQKSLEFFGVDANSRRCGFGSKVIKEFICSQVDLDFGICLRCTKKLYKFYSKLGFVKHKNKATSKQDIIMFISNNRRYKVPIIYQYSPELIKEKIPYYVLMSKWVELNNDFGLATN